MNYNAFSKTLLNIYNSLDAVCERIDKMVENKAMAGALGDCGNRNPLELFNNLIDLSQRKLNLVNLKIRIERAFSRLKEKQAKVLILKYVDGLTFKQIANLTGQSIRNCFRLCDMGIENFGKIIKTDGLSEEKIENTYGDEKWIFQIYDKEMLEKHAENVIYKAPYITGRDIARIASKKVISF